MDENLTFHGLVVKMGRNRINNLLNIAILVVVLLIVVTTASLFMKDNNAQTDETEQSVSNENVNNNEKNNVVVEDDDVIEDGVDSGNETADNSEANENDPVEENSNEQSEIVNSLPSDDVNVLETIINPAWKPIGTKQTGEHVSLYDLESLDWYEKKDAIAYATGHPTDALIYWKIKNGGSPQKSIGIVSTKNKSEMYKVYIEWVDNEGWLPVSMDVLTNLDFKY